MRLVVLRAVTGRTQNFTISCSNIIFEKLNSIVSKSFHKNI